MSAKGAVVVPGEIFCARAVAEPRLEAGHRAQEALQLFRRAVEARKEIRRPASPRSAAGRCAIASVNEPQ